MNPISLCDGTLPLNSKPLEFTTKRTQLRHILHERLNVLNERKSTKYLLNKVLMVDRCQRPGLLRVCSFTNRRIRLFFFEDEIEKQETLKAWKIISVHFLHCETPVFVFLFFSLCFKHWLSKLHV